jgi:hypothetical protein
MSALFARISGPSARMDGVLTMPADQTVITEMQRLTPAICNCSAT